MRIQGYTVGDLLGSGGMGAVYRARSADGKEVALKVLKSCPAGSVARFMLDIAQGKRPPR